MTLTKPPLREASPPDLEFSSGLIRTELRRLLDDADFPASEIRRKLLAHVVEETISGRGEKLKGVVLAQDVFDRDADFNQQTDPVVRIEARRLRRDLDSYYAHHADRCVIRFSIPKGAYVVAFERQAAPGFVPDAQPLVDPSDGATKRGSRLSLPVIGLLGVILVLVAAVVAAFFYGKRFPQAAPAELAPKIAVADVRNLSGADDLTYFADGLTHQIIDRLMRYDSFSITALPDAETVLTAETLAALRAEHGITHVASGSLMPGGGDSDLRFLVQLYRTDGQIVWSGTYGGEMTARSMQRLQDSIATQVAGVLAQTYGVVALDEHNRVQPDTAAEEQTFGCLLRAHYYRRNFARALRAPVLDCLRAATVSEPDNSDAWAMLGWVLRDAAMFEPHDETERRALMEQALASTDRALELGQNSQLALQAHSANLYYTDHFAEAEALIRRAHDLNPQDPEVLHQLGWRLAARGHLSEGVGYVREAISRSIDAPSRYYNFLAIEALIEGRDDDLRGPAEMSSNGGSAVGDILLAIAQHRAGADPAQVEATFRRAERRIPGIVADPVGYLAGHRVVPEIIDPIVAAMKDAGWSPDLAKAQ